MSNKNNKSNKEKEIERFDCPQCGSANIYMQRIPLANEEEFGIFTICGDCGKKFGIKRTLEEINLINRFINNCGTSPDLIQCTACRKSSLPTSWMIVFNKNIKIRACPYCGTMKYIYAGNIGFKIDEDVNYVDDKYESIQTSTEVRDEFGFHKGDWFK